MLIFIGENSDGWIFQAKKHFNINYLTEGERLAVAAMSVDGDALSWL